MEQLLREVDETGNAALVTRNHNGHLQLLTHGSKEEKDQVREELLKRVQIKQL